MTTNLLFSAILALFLFSCSTQKVNQNILSGNYEVAFSESVEKVQRAKNLEKIPQTIKDLEIYFAKANRIEWCSYF